MKHFSDFLLLPFPALVPHIRMNYPPRRSPTRHEIPAKTNFPRLRPRFAASISKFVGGGPHSWTHTPGQLNLIFLTQPQEISSKVISVFYNARTLIPTRSPAAFYSIFSSFFFFSLLAERIFTHLWEKLDEVFWLFR